MNVDPQEIDKFAQSADTWWDDDGKQSPLHLMTEARMQFISQFCHTGQTALDAGCGGGIITEELAKKKLEVTGIDACSELISIAQTHQKASNLTIDYRCMSIDEHAIGHEGKYSLITCLDMLEHVPDPNQIVTSLANMLADNGTLIIQTINRTPQAFLSTILGAEFILRMLPIGTHHYEKYITPAELSQHTRQNKLHTLSIKGLCYSPFQKQLTLSDNIKANYICAFTKVITP